MRTHEEILYENPLLNENAVDKATGAGYHNPLQESRESRKEEAVLKPVIGRKRSGQGTWRRLP